MIHPDKFEVGKIYVYARDHACLVKCIGLAGRGHHRPDPIGAGEIVTAWKSTSSGHDYVAGQEFHMGGLLNWLGPVENGEVTVTTTWGR